MIVALAHVILLFFVATEDADFCNFGIKKSIKHGIAKRACAAGDT